MYCKYCGKEIENGREVCAECEAIRILQLQQTL